MALTLPSTPSFVRCRWGLIGNTQYFDSPVSKTVQTFRLTGDRWKGEWEYAPINGKIDRATAAEWEAFFADLEGRANRFAGKPPFRAVARGAIRSMSPLVNGGSQTGGSLNIDGLSNNVNNVAMKGDYFVVNSELKMITANANSNGSGQATISFKPRLRTAPADNAVLSFTDPSVSMIVITDDNAWEIDKFGKFTFTLSAIEAWESTNP